MERYTNYEVTLFTKKSWEDKFEVHFTFPVYGGLDQGTNVFKFNTLDQAREYARTKVKETNAIYDEITNV